MVFCFFCLGGSMGNSIPAKDDITLYDLETKFNLQLTQESQFFPEWQVGLSEVTRLRKNVP